MIEAFNPAIPMAACPLCGSERTRERGDLSTILSLPASIPNRVRQCDRCRFWFISPYLSSDELEALYSGTYFQGVADGDVVGSGVDYEEHCAVIRLEKFRATLDGLLALHPHAKAILDVGAATGEFLVCAREKGLEVAGIELSQYACDRAHEKYGLDLTNQPFESFEPGRKFDLLHLNHVLEHFPNPHAAVKSIARVLAPGGLVYIEVPYQFNTAETVAGRLGLFKRSFSTFSLHHPVFFTPATLRRLFKDHGLQPVSVRCYCWDRYGDAPTSLPRRLARSFLKAIGQGQIIEGVFRNG